MHIVFMTSLWTATVIAVAVLVGTTLPPITAADSLSQRHVVEIRDLKFTPKELTVAPGDTITWINHDLVPHTVTADDDSWDSGFVGAQGEWQIVVQAGMPTTYFCRYHPSMTARLQIVRR